MMDFVRQVLIWERQRDGCVKRFIVKYLLTATVDFAAALIGRAPLNQPRHVGEITRIILEGDERSHSAPSRTTPAP